MNVQSRNRAREAQALEQTPAAGAIPRSPAFDETLSLLREGYGFLPRRFADLDTPIFRTRLMLRDVICMTGPAAAKLVYDDARLTRVGAMPQTVLRLLQDKGSVQQLDGPAHRHRKAMFVRMLMEDKGGLERLVAIFRRCFLERVPEWMRWGAVQLGAEMDIILFRTALAWTQAPLDADEVEADATLMADMVENAGHVRPRTLGTLMRRSALERRLRAKFRDIRRGRLVPMPDSPLAMLAGYRDAHGELLSPRVAAVELINLLRPIVAIGRYIVFAALRLERHPQWREILAEPDPERLSGFVEEVRRISPFFPFVGAVARAPFTWNGHRIRRGQWLLLDLYGNCHDEAVFREPDAFRPTRGLRHHETDYSFIPQGAGSASRGHRCPGEMATVEIMKEAVRLLTGTITYSVPEQDLSVSLLTVPTGPKEGFIITDVAWRAMPAV
ncbi:cytochrome P450 [Rhizobium glycinendophyticum]|uniref:Cytochrome P450 n=1 Tax=Rhizobium glycinendophyticum TaxID=2589807 RepID=A0A504UHW8_9HYPH|nr:cytochrome P450 [Rhizobium glycinendophyticum]TPP10355.1 cytochrome P450 [Rhizobium glycinendophyticum]